MEHYGKKARFFVYNSSNLNQLDNFSSNAGINVMIINTQAFASSLKEDGRSKEARIIYSKRDEFGSRRPIDVIKANRPIIILDEPQKMGGAVTQKALKNFNPLFTLNYSATHAVQHNRTMFSEILLVLSAPDTDGVDFFFRNDQTRHIIISVQFIPKTIAVVVDVFFHIANLHVSFEIDSSEWL